MARGRSKASSACLASALALCWSAARAQTAGPGDAPIGGRPAAMGHAYTALAADAYAPVWNPAGVALLRAPQAALLQAAQQGGSSRGSAAFAAPFGALQGGGLSVDFSRGQAMYGLAYGRRFGAAALGAAARYLDGDGSADARPHGYAADLAALYRFDERLSVAAVAANLGGRPEALSQPGFRSPQGRFAAGYAASRRLTYALEAVCFRGGDAGIRTGVEARLLGFLLARVGVDSTVERSSALGLTGGFGLDFANQSLDLAWVPRGARSWEQVSWVVRFGAVSPSASPRVEADAKPETERPAPDRRAARTAPLTFHLEPSSATPTGFISNPPDPDWEKPKTPSVPEKPRNETPVAPGMIWLQQ